MLKFLMVIIVSYLSMLSGVLSAQHVVLRDLTFIEAAKVESMDVNGLVLDGGLQFLWSDILQGKVGQQQNKFDGFLKEIGLPLFRIQSRLAGGSFDDLQPMANQLLQISADKAGPTAYIANAASFHDFLSQGMREAAAVPLINILAMRTAAPDLKSLDRELGLRFKKDVCLNLLPIWFDDSAAKLAWQNLQSASGLNAANLKQENPYLLSLQILNEPQTTDLTSKVKKETGWGPILVAQSAWLNSNPGSALESLQNSSPNLDAAQRALALYYRGLAMRDLNMKSPSDATAPWKLILLQIPAQYENQFPELSAAAIYQVLAGSRDMPEEFESLQQELTNRFPTTWHGRHYQSSRK